MLIKTCLAKLFNKINNPNSDYTPTKDTIMPSSLITSGGTSATTSGTYTTSTMPPVGIFSIPTPTYSLGTTVYGGGGGSTTGVTSTYSPYVYSSTRSYIMSLHDTNGNEIVKLNNDGTVEWKNGIQIDEAAEALGKCMSISAENQAGITSTVKSKMRDSVFNDLIEIAKESGPLSSETLTYLLSASKIVEKLKGKE